MARDFDGSSDITYTLAAGQISTTIESWSFWIYPDTNGQYVRPIHLGGTGGDRDRSFEMDDGWGFVFNFDWATDGGAWSVTKPTTGSWQHYVVTYDGSSILNDPIIYKDGASVAITERVAPLGLNIRSSRTDLTVGSEASTGQYWDGRIAEVAKWNRILTPGEVLGLGKGFSPSYYQNGLLLYLPLIGRNTTEPDKRFGTAGSVDAGVTAISHPRIIYPTNSKNRRWTTGAAPASGKMEWPSFMSRGFMSPRF